MAGLVIERTVRLTLLALSIRNLALAMDRGLVTAKDASQYLADYADEISAEAKIRQEEGA